MHTQAKDPRNPAKLQTHLSGGSRRSPLNTRKPKARLGPKSSNCTTQHGHMLCKKSTAIFATFFSDRIDYRMCGPCEK